MNWVFSPPARAGLGAPELLVVAIIVAFLLVGALEVRSGDAENRGLLLTRKQKWVALAMTVPLISLVGLLAWRQFLG